MTIETIIKNSDIFPIILRTAKNLLHSKIEGLEIGAVVNRNMMKEYFVRSLPVSDLVVA